MLQKVKTVKPVKVCKKKVIVYRSYLRPKCRCSCFKVLLKFNETILTALLLLPTPLKLGVTNTPLHFTILRCKGVIGTRK